MKLWYLPLEAYAARYTEYLSTPYGFVETDLKRLQIPYEVIRPHNDLLQITTGQVLDVTARTIWAFDQIAILVAKIVAGEVKRDDVIYIEDMWHPGFEQLPYAMAMKFGHDRKTWPKMYVFCHAQSVDENDFTYPMRGWMRNFEHAIAKLSAGIFVAAKGLEDRLENAKVSHGNVHTVGTVFNGEVLMSIAGMSKLPMVKNRGKRVVYSSRWDSEKDPMFFLQLVEHVMERRKDIEFVVCSSNPQIRSNAPGILSAFKTIKARFQKNFTVHTNLSKQKYFEILSKSKVQFNCAKQDWVSYVLLEAALFGCAPLYVSRLSFPRALDFNMEHLFTPESIPDAYEKLCKLIDSKEERTYEWVYRRYEGSFHRMLSIMGFKVAPPPELAVR